MASRTAAISGPSTDEALRLGNESTSACIAYNYVPHGRGDLAMLAVRAPRVLEVVLRAFLHSVGRLGSYRIPYSVLVGPLNHPVCPACLCLAFSHLIGIPKVL